MAERTHDYTPRVFGLDYFVDEVKGNWIRLGGWGPLPGQGDYILLRNGPETTRYRMLTSESRGNPPDMWRGTAEFAPRANQPAPERPTVEQMPAVICLRCQKPADAWQIMERKDTRGWQVKVTCHGATAYWLVPFDDLYRVEVRGEYAVHILAFTEPEDDSCPFCDSPDHHLDFHAAELRVELRTQPRERP
jgi:hypothetical protein